MVYEVRYKYYNMKSQYASIFETREEAMEFIEYKKKRSKGFEEHKTRNTRDYKYWASSFLITEIALITRKTLILYNPHPNGSKMGDCARRALTLFLDKDYNEVKRIMTANARKRGGRYNSQMNLFAYMRQEGHKFIKMDKGTSVYDVIRKYPKGTFILDQEDHWVTLKDGKIYDTGAHAYDNNVNGIFIKKGEYKNEKE